ncbi:MULTISPECIES: cation transporter [unclassified Methylophaga]|jgi:cobalt-zinc-cadmium efflux system protein|uniref:cation transporter n=1 Tax=unclassified Methylophaga TaxID=2629249 RepID=UPI000C9741A8|nr:MULTISPECIES: cation transporter [unclassified Methylophaga]MAP25351.1 RND transporter [Methylophaga sp.]HBX59050.1 RND transporter [Methylophaga sp.]|tara:strand:- start:1305 stop:1931 length:627 start_codon:yes stop_codon:yes gene_type:complete
MTDVNLDLSSADKRRTLWVVLILNVAIAVGFLVTGYVGNSNALIANGLDNTSDAIVYGLSLLALSRSRAWKRGAARFSGFLLLVFSAGVVLDAIRRYFEGSEPTGAMMMSMAAVAAVVNLLSLYLLKKMQSKDVNLRAATTFSINDFVANGGVILAGIVVIWTDSNLPDLLVGVAVAGIALYGAINILRDAHMDIHEEQGTKHRGKNN